MPRTRSTCFGSTGTTTPSGQTSPRSPATSSCRARSPGSTRGIVVVFGNRFPLIRTHKVLAAYACLAPRVITGQFDPSSHRAVWPSTGNYCRGGVAISRLMGCRGVAVLPEGMSKERFTWLEEWVVEPDDIIPTPGTESNVKEIYDKCAELSKDPQNVIFNQFSEFGNHLAHYLCTGTALAAVFEALRARDPALSLAAFVSATGSAGSIAAGDYLKEAYAAKSAPSRRWNARPCSRTASANTTSKASATSTSRSYITSTTLTSATAITDRATDQLSLLFAEPSGRAYLAAGAACRRKSSAYSTRSDSRASATSSPP